MKKILIGLTLLASMSSFATDLNLSSFKCMVSASNMDSAGIDMVKNKKERSLTYDGIKFVATEVEKYGRAAFKMNILDVSKDIKVENFNFMDVKVLKSAESALFTSSGIKYLILCNKPL